MDHRENGMESTGEAAGASVELQGPWQECVFIKYAMEISEKVLGRRMTWSYLCDKECPECYHVSHHYMLAHVL